VPSRRAPKATRPAHQAQPETWLTPVNRPGRSTTARRESILRYGAAQPNLRCEAVSASDVIKRRYCRLWGDVVLVLLSGPAGAGTSTAAQAWAARGDRPRAVIDVDALRLLIRAGAALPEYGWTDETARQWDIAMDLWQAMAKVYRAHRIDCMVDLYAPPVDDQTWRDLVSELGLVRVILLPQLAVCLERNRQRAQQPLLSDADLRRNYEDFAECVQLCQPDHVIDNSHISIGQTLEAIEAEIDKQAVV
jgi:hypothetical protein